MLSSFSARLQEALQPLLARAGVPAAVEREFAERCAARLDEQGKVLLTVVLVCDLVWWPLDWVVLAPFPERLPIALRFRVLVAVVAALYLLMPRTPAVKRSIQNILAVFMCLGTGIAGASAGALGGFENPYFHAIYVTMFATVPLPLTLRARALTGGLIAISTAAGLLILHPEHRSSPQLPFAFSYLAFSFLISLWFGHTQFNLNHDNFVQAYLLVEHGRTLESRVAERTEELRALLDHVETAREVERTRIARELHDELGQELSALRYSLGFTRTRYGKEPTAIAANLDDLEALLRRTAVTTRNLVTDLRPRVLDDLGLNAAVEWLVERTQKHSDLSCKLTVSGELAMADRTATTAFRVLQEALTNVVRHARAKQAEVSILAADGTLTLRVTDDGIGVDAGRANPEGAVGGVGLIGMRERVHALGGSVALRDRRPQRGTEVRCTLPLFPQSVRTGQIPGAQS